MKKLITILFTLILLTACGTKEKDANHLKLGMIGSDSVVWNYIIEELKKDDITLEIIAFSDYTQVNAALDQGEIDLNAFQHQAYLDKENEELGYDIVSIGKTVIAPLGLYSNNITDIKEVKKGDTVSIPNDVTNGGRALQLLEAAGLLELEDVAVPSLKDIKNNPYDLEILEIAAANLPITLDDVTLAAINSGIAVDAGFSPAQDSIVFEEVALDSDNPYINIIAANRKDKDNPLFKKVLDVYYTDAVRELIIEDSKGASIPVW